MKEYPPIPTVEEAPADVFESGHLWVLERLDCPLLRFQLKENGVIQFGTRERVFSSPDAAQEAFLHAIRHVQEFLDRDALESAVDDVEDVVFFGAATHKRTISYDWERMPSFLGFDVWSGRRGELLPPDTVEVIFERLGLQPVNTVEREVNARDLDPESYVIPESNWCDEPAAGVVFRNKAGGRARLDRPLGPPGGKQVSTGTTATEFVSRHVTTERVEREVRRIEESNREATFEEVYDRVLEDVAREFHELLYQDSAFDLKSYRSEVAAVVRSALSA